MSRQTKKLSLLERAQLMCTGKLPPPPVAQLIGFKLTEIAPGRAVIELQTSEEHRNPMGTLHGGILCDIADAAMGLAYAASLGQNDSFTTLELKINFLRPVWNSKLKATGKVVSSGRTIALTECDILDEKERLIARATSTCMRLTGDMAKGR